MPTFVSPKYVFDKKTVVFATADAEFLALLSSTIHYWWTISRTGTMRVDPSYSPTDVFLTFARPESVGPVRDLGERLHSYRSSLMVDRNEGLTKTYNRVHDPNERASDIAELRRIHIEIDHSIAKAYDWADLALDHDFYETLQGTRYTVGPVARQEILDRLLQLNFDRYDEEVANGLHANRPIRGGA